MKNKELIDFNNHCIALLSGMMDSLTEINRALEQKT